MDLSLTQPEYETLVGLARVGMRYAGKSAGVEQDSIYGLEQFLKVIEARNGVARHAIMVQWQELDTPLVPYARFPRVWPADQRKLIERVGGPITKADVESFLKDNARSPTQVLVTTDLSGVVGWTELDVFFK